MTLLSTILLASCRPAPKGADRTRWDERYSSEKYIYGTEPADFLKENIGLLPRGRALDLAAGEGRNAVFLAQEGFSVVAVDVSPVGLKKAKRLAKDRGVKIKTVVADLSTYELGRARYDVVANFYYLQRDLSPRIKRALKPGGVVIYETYTVAQLEMPGAHKPKKEYLLALGELKRMFADFEILHYSETKSAGKAVASLIARKPL